MDVYRLKATRGHGWVQAVSARGPSVTADWRGAKQYPTFADAERALARVNRPGIVPCEIVVGPSVGPAEPIPRGTF